MVDALHLVVFDQRADRIQLACIGRGFIAQAVVLGRDDQGGCDALEMVAVGAPGRRRERITSPNSVGDVRGVEDISHPWLQHRPSAAVRLLVLRRRDQVQRGVVQHLKSDVRAAVQ